ncbi:MAG: two-component system phosphate regulon sensor histidine kinase PhoR [Kiritimatiellia bacterium]|jgi:two-component system phosphate regulon sensor histidine kinase PhoR
MQQIGVRTRILLVTIALVITVGVPVGGLVEWRQRTQLQEMVELNLQRSAMAVTTYLRAVNPDDVDEAVDEMAIAQGVRITIIDSRGHVMADSDLDGDALTGLDNHHDRPEVVSARANGIGRSTRWSATLGKQMQYVAVDVSLKGDQVFVRSAAPLDRIERIINQLRITLLFGGGLALVLALMTGSLVATWIGGMLRGLVKSAQVLAMGEHPDLRYDTSVEGMGHQLRAAVRELAGERDQLQAVLGAVGDGVIAVDDHLHITMLNAQAKQLLGRRAKVGSSLVDVGSAAMVDLAHTAILGESATDEIRWPGLPVKTLEITGARFEHQEGCVLVVHDLTVLRKLERVRSDFVANVSHELRTPISIITATTETLLAGAIDDPKARKRFIKANHRHARRLGALVNDLLSLSRIEAGQMPMHPLQLDVTSTVVRIAEDVTDDATDDATRVDLQISSGLQLYADHHGLEHALGNLIDNARKYSPPDTTIIVRAFSEGNRTIIEVADQGPGIPLEHRSRVFERFYRVDAGRSRAVGGTGLGLSIVRHLVEAMGGRVSVHPNEPMGSIFRLDLPARPDPAAQNRE